MTSLELQLKRLKVPESQVLAVERDRSSLLFDAKEAAGLGRKDFYNIGKQYRMSFLFYKNIPIITKNKTNILHLIIFICNRTNTKAGQFSNKTLNHINSAKQLPNLFLSLTKLSFVYNSATHGHAENVYLIDMLQVRKD